MINRLKQATLGTLFVSVMALGTLLMPVVANAQSGVDCDNPLQCGSQNSANESQPTDLTGENGVFKTITNVLLFLIGAISVIMIIYGGIVYTTSGGDSSRVSAAKNTILYAVVGLVVAILAFAVVNFVVGSFSSN